MRPSAAAAALRRVLAEAAGRGAAAERRCRARCTLGVVAGDWAELLRSTGGA